MDSHVAADASGDVTLDELIVCPVCHSTLASGAGSGDLSCAQCGRTYPARETFLDLIPFPPPDDVLTQEWALWEQLQQNGEVCYTADPEANLSVGEREDASAFRRFSELEGLVLDVGCGPQRLPSYGTDFPGRLVGIDPLMGVRERRFLFARAIGEYLPFRDGTFDRVLFATSLDHVMDPLRTLREARRVLAPAGAVMVWCSESDHEIAQPEPDAALGWRGTVAAAFRLLREGRFSEFGSRLAERLGRARADTPGHDYLTDLAVPDGAVDQFHAFHLHREEVEDLLQQAGLAVTGSATCGGNVFVRACDPEDDGR